MNGIDISGFQKGINLEKVPGDFVIIKATQNKSFVNSSMTDQIASAQKAGKLIGLYHYAGGAGAETEADHFINIVKKYIGKAVLVLDWEQGQNSAFEDESYAKTWLDTVKKQTGVTPMIYMSQSVCAKFAHTDGITDYPLWVAQYGSTAQQYGYDETPWKKGSVSPWKKETIRQYSSSGRLDGWSYVLDLDIAYIDKTEWIAMAAKQKTTITEVTKVDKNTYKIKAKNGITYTLYDITYGDKGETVKFLQQLLTNAGFKCSADGICGNETLEALAEYQASKHRTTCGKGTWETLLK